MKRVITVVLLIVIAVSLTACSTRPEGTEMQTLVTKSGMVKAVYDYDAQTITVGGDAYHYEYSGGDCTITYPNGAAYWESATSYGAVSGWDGDYDTELYIDGSVLAQYLTKAYEGEKDQFTLTGGMLIGCLFLAAFGALLVYDPETMLSMRYQWRFKNVEPTEAAILETRIIGVLFIVVVVVIILLAIFL